MISRAKVKKMVIKQNEMSIQVRPNLKGGKGNINFVNLVDVESMKNCRLMTKMTIPVGASIGEHKHESETEYYLIQSGCVKVIDDQIENIVGTGDVVITDSGCSHSIINIGDAPAIIIAIIITY